jgi:hypothetical protein
MNNDNVYSKKLQHRGCYKSILRADITERTDQSKNKKYMLDNFQLISLSSYLDTENVKKILQEDLEINTKTRVSSGLGVYLNC